MKRSFIKVFISTIVVLLLLLFISIKNILLWPGFYKSNSSLDDETNKEIKALLLNVMKDQHSTIYLMNKDKLYTDEYRLEYMQYDNSSTAKSLFISLDSYFMESAKKVNDDEYTAELQMRFPDDWYYYFKIKVIDDQFLISYLEIDP